MWVVRDFTLQLVDADCMAGSRYVGIDRDDRRLLEYQSNDDVYQIVDRFEHTRTHGTRAQLEREEQAKLEKSIRNFP